MYWYAYRLIEQRVIVLPMENGEISHAARTAATVVTPVQEAAVEQYPCFLYTHIVCELVAGMSTIGNLAGAPRYMLASIAVYPHCLHACRCA